MGSEQFSQAVRGSTGAPLDVSTRDSIETDEYGDATPVVSSTYPISIDPAFLIEEILVFTMPSDKTIDLTLDDGTAVNGIELRGATMVLNTLEVDSITINDPDASGGDTSLLVVGDA